MSRRRPSGFISAFYDPLKVPNAPTGASATGGDQSASVSFTPPANVGGSAVSAYYAVSNPGQITGTGASSPVSVTGLTNGTAYTFAVWALNTYGPSPYSAASGSVTPVGQTGLFGGGQTNAESQTNTIQYITITSTGNATDFGDLTVARIGVASAASSTRGLFAGRNGLDVIDYVAFASTGNAVSFGSLTNSVYLFAGCGSSTRGLFGGGASTTNVIQYVTFASTSNAIDFGDLTVARYQNGAFSSTTRGVFAGGENNIINFNTIDYVTIASTGNATDFGDMISAVRGVSGCSSSTRGLIGGGDTTNVIQYVTIASTGNATDFGDLTVARANLASVSGTTRSVFAGGVGASSYYSTIDYVDTASTGDATDFGNLTTGTRYFQGCSNAHGGL